MNNINKVEGYRVYLRYMEKEVSKPVLVIALTTMFLLISAFLPAKWLGVKPVRVNRNPVDFTQLQERDRTLYDTNKDDKISWNEIVVSTEAGSASVAELKDSKINPKRISELNNSENITASFSKGLYIASTQMTNSGPTSAQTQQAVLDSLIKDEAYKIISKKYSYSDIKVSSSDTKETAKVYGNETAKILKDFITEKKVDEDASGFGFYAQTQNEEYLQPLKENALNLNKIIGKLLAVSVPPSATMFHILMLNKMTTYKDTVENLSNAADDPLRATITFDKYPNTVIDTLLIYRDLSNYFTTKNIVFTSKEAGYVFTVGYTF